jgi:SAM-dependent methyltransferase
LPEFDEYAEDYKKLADDPILQRFGGEKAFFFERKWELLEEYLHKIGLRPGTGSWLDVGCGTGELLRLGKAYFADAMGCDLSTGMLKACDGLNVVPQTDPTRLPFEDNRFDLVTVVCVYHHVEPPDRAALTAEIARVTRPGGTACMIEHNPYNPVSQFAVSRIPVDENAKLLSARTALRLMSDAGLVEKQRVSYFLYLPKSIYRKAKGVESSLSRIPFGGQYAAFSCKPT